MSDESQEQPRTITVYEAVGGDDYFHRLIDRFFVRVAADPVLSAMYPEDLSESRRTTALFLIQYWGGHQAYSDERGHPRLRMRHMPFTIAEDGRNRWVQHMVASIEDEPLRDDVKEMFINYFEHGATAMINTYDDEA